jgi:hypothetical protein
VRPFTVLPEVQGDQQCGNDLLKRTLLLAKFNGKSKELEFDGKSMMHEQPAAYQEPKNAGGKRAS